MNESHALAKFEELSLRLHGMDPVLKDLQEAKHRSDLATTAAATAHDEAQSALLKNGPGTPDIASMDRFAAWKHAREHFFQTIETRRLLVVKLCRAHEEAEKIAKEAKAAWARTFPLSVQVALQVADGPDDVEPAIAEPKT